MSQSIPMPALGESVTEGTVTRWLKQVGDQVAVDEPLVEISTDKVDTEIPSPFAGVLLEILVPEDEVAEVGQMLATLGAADDVPPPPPPPPGGEAPGEPAPAAVPAPAPAEAPPAPAPAAAPVAPPSPPVAPPLATPAPVPPPLSATPPAPVAPPLSSTPAPAAPPASQAPAVQPPAAAPAPAASPLPDAGTYVSPLVRKLAAREGVDLAQVHGTGVGGRIRREDVLSAKPAPLPPVADGTQSSDAESEVRLSRLRSMTAERALNDRPVIAQLTSVTQVDVTDINELVAHAQERFSTREGIALTAVPFIALAVIEGLKANPDLNAAIVGNEVVHNPKENLGLTVDTPLGPVVAVVADAGSLGLVGLARGIAAVTGRVLGGALLPTDLVGGTFTLTNPGAGQVLFDSPIVTEPQVAILSVGAAIKRPVVINDAIAIRQMMYLALSYDSRLIDSTTAGRFLAGIKERLEGGHFETELGL